MKIRAEHLNNSMTGSQVVTVGGGGIPSFKEPLLAALQPGPRIRLPRAEARGDILYVLTNEHQVGDVSVVHPGAAPYRRAAAATHGAAAAQRDTEKRAQYEQDEWDAYRFTLLSVEPLGAWART
jgi:hypothetical protein